MSDDARRPRACRLEVDPVEESSVVIIPSPWLNVEQAAQYIQQHPRAIYRAAGSGKLRSVRINGKGELRTRREWLDQWLERFARGGEDATTTVAPAQEVMAYVARRR
jgi:excisionase family DNA binding protein